MLAKIPSEEHEKYNALLKQYFDFGKIFSKSDAELMNLHMEMGRYLLIGMGYEPSYLANVPSPAGWSSFAVYFSSGWNGDYRPAIGNITAPTLVVQGDDDAIALAGSRKYEKYIPNANFISIDCQDKSKMAGHLVYDDCQAEFTAAVRDFLTATEQE